MKAINLKPSNIFVLTLVRTIFFGSFISLMLLTFSPKLTETLIHEILGVIMSVTVIIHILQNQFFFKNLLIINNIYSLFKSFISLLLLIDFIILIITGILISIYLFSFMHIDLPYVRQLHTFSAYLAVVLIGCHIGLFFSQFFNFLTNSLGKYISLLIKLLLVVCVINGIKVFITDQYIEKLTFKQSFSFWDYDAFALIPLINNLCVIILFVYISYTITSCLLYILFRK